jgi:hypothetical protein
MSTVVLVHATRAPVTPELVDRIEAAALRPDVPAARVAIPIGTRERPFGSPTAIGTAAVGVEPATAVRPADGRGPVAVLTTAENSGRPARLRRVCALEELDPAAEGDAIGVVVLAGSTTRLTSVDQVRDLLAASGWPLLGVLGVTGRGARK